MAFRTRIKDFRARYDLTQEDLASLTGLSQGHLAAIEGGQYLPQKRTRKRLERILGSEVNWLTTYAKDRGHIGYALRDLINAEEPGAGDRIKYCKQYLQELNRMMK